MKMRERIRKRMRRDRPMTTISIRMPEDVIDDLKEVAPIFGFSGYQLLIRAYILDAGCGATWRRWSRPVQTR